MLNKKGVSFVTVAGSIIFMVTIATLCLTFALNNSNLVTQYKKVSANYSKVNNDLYNAAELLVSRVKAEDTPLTSADLQELADRTLGVFGVDPLAEKNTDEYYLDVVADPTKGIATNGVQLTLSKGNYSICVFLSDDGSQKAISDIFFNEDTAIGFAYKTGFLASSYLYENGLFFNPATNSPYYVELDRLNAIIGSTSYTEAQKQTVKESFNSLSAEVTKLYQEILPKTPSTEATNPVNHLFETYTNDAGIEDTRYKVDYVDSKKSFDNNGLINRAIRNCFPLNNLSQYTDSQLYKNGRDINTDLFDDSFITYTTSVSSSWRKSYNIDVTINNYINSNMMINNGISYPTPTNTEIAFEDDVKNYYKSILESERNISCSSSTCNVNISYSNSSYIGNTLYIADGVTVYVNGDVDLSYDYPLIKDDQKAYKRMEIVLGNKSNLIVNGNIKLSSNSQMPAITMGNESHVMATGDIILNGVQDLSKTLNSGTYSWWANRANWSFLDKLLWGVLGNMLGGDEYFENLEKQIAGELKGTFISGGSFRFNAYDISGDNTATPHVPTRATIYADEEIDLSHCLMSYSEPSFYFCDILKFFDDSMVVDTFLDQLFNDTSYGYVFAIFDTDFDFASSSSVSGNEFKANIFTTNLDYTDEVVQKLQEDVYTEKTDGLVGFLDWAFTNVLGTDIQTSITTAVRDDLNVDATNLGLPKVLTEGSSNQNYITYVKKDE